MRTSKTSVHSWLSLRIRVLCCAVFAASLFLPPYVPVSSTMPPTDVDPATEGYLLAEEGFLMKTSSLTEQGTRSAFSQGIIHTVESGESIASISRTAFLKPETIRWANNLSDTASVKSGQKLLLLPVDGVLHKVKRGQNLQTIADLYSVPAPTIASQNKITGGYLLAGQDLIVPGGKPIVEAAPAPPKVVATKATSATVPNTVTKAPDKSFAIQASYGILQMPCDCFYTQYYNTAHFGIDLQHRGGSPNFAAEAGTVIRADYGWNGGYGNVIEIDHGNGLVTLYAHNKELYVKKGDTVTRGQAIAFMGNTGRVHGPTGIHLHFEVQVNGVKKNPLVYLQQ
ncbi:MAG: peptidoglycan DD-metalloendopeptidase family protein [Candidatus Peribacteraceae bacterium]|nr:peptidoglycan DD-metalloendopeptidase family protein [Candidatus Peribacteraceae bacterium]